jgi:hypothetical protein
MSKRELDRNKMVAAGLGGLVVLTAGGLAWLALSNLGEKNEEAQALAERLGNPALAALLADSGGSARALREAAEIQKMTKELQDQNTVALGWSQATHKLTGEGEEWAREPGKWKDRLIAVQNQLQKEAREQKVQLSPDFYLGLDKFRQISPTLEQVPELALHLSVAEHLLRLLMKARTVAEQYPTLCEFRSIAGPGTLLEDEGSKGASPDPSAGSKANSPSSAGQRKNFRMEIRASPEVLYEYVRLMVTDSALLILTDLSVKNEKQDFPQRSEIAKRFQQEPSPATTDGAANVKEKGKKLLEILAGEESLSATIEISFVAWKTSEDPKAGNPAGGSK